MKSLKSNIDSRRGKNVDILLISEEVRNRSWGNDKCIRTVRERNLNPSLSLEAKEREPEIEVEGRVTYEKFNNSDRYTQQ